MFNVLTEILIKNQFDIVKYVNGRGSPIQK